MRKILKNHLKAYKIKRKSLINKPKIVIEVFCFGICVMLLVFAVAPLFNVKIFNNKQDKMCEEYYIIYTTPNSTEQSKIIEEAQNLCSRGAGGNIAQHLGNTVIVLTESKSLETAQKIINNLASQEIFANYYALKTELNLKGLTEQQKQITKKIFEAQNSIIKKLFNHIEMLENKTTTETDVAIEVFGFYSELNALLLGLQNSVDDVTKFCFQQATNFQGYLFLLSQNNTNNNSYVSTIRYYLFKLLDLICFS